MADRLKGIVVEIGADTVGLDKALKGVNQTSRTLQGELSQVQRLLKFDPNSAELIAQKQKLLTDQVENTTKKLDQLKAAQAQVQAQFEKGEIGADQYRAFQREIVATEGRLKHFQNSLQDVEQEQTNVAESSKQLKRLFEATKSSVDDYADVLGTRLTRAIQDGTATSKDLQKAFDLVGKAAIGAGADLDQVRQALQKLDAGESSIKGVRKELQKLSQDAQDAKGDVKDLGGELAGLAAGAAAGVGIGGIIEKSMEQAQQAAIIEVTLDLDEKSNQGVKDAINSIKSYGLEGEEALEAVRKQWQINGDASDETNTKIIKAAGAISAAYGNIDLQELIQESSEVGSALGISQEQALGLTNALLKAGFPDDQLDIIAEYGSQLARAGYSAEEIQGIFAAGVDTKSWNIDVLLDGVKEGRILLAEFGAGIDEATTELIQGTGISSEQLQTWGAAVAEGGEAGKSAFMEVALALSGIEDATKRNEVGTKLFGTLWEEQGSKITDTLINAAGKTGDLAANQKQVNDLVSTMDSTPMAQMNLALTTIWNTMQPLLGVVSEFMLKIAEWVQKNPELAAGITAVVVVIGILIGLAMALVPIIWALAGAAGALNIGMLPITLTILAIVAAIGLAIAAGVAIYKNWDKIKAGAADLAKTIKTKFEEFKNAASEKIKAAKTSIETTWNGVMSFFRGINLKQIGKDIIQGLIDGIRSMITKVQNAARDVANGIGNKVKQILKLGSPSKLMIEMGQFTGEGMAIGLKKSMGQVSSMASELSQAVVPEIPNQTPIQANAAGAIGAGQTLTVNLHSPKALDIREANRAFNRTLNRMSLMW